MWVTTVLYFQILAIKMPTMPTLSFTGYKLGYTERSFWINFSEKVSLVPGLQHVVFVDEIPAVPKQSYTEFHHLCHLLRGVRTAALRVTLPGSDGNCVSAFMKNQDGTDSIGSNVCVGGGGQRIISPTTVL